MRGQPIAGGGGGPTPTAREAARLGVASEGHPWEPEAETASVRSGPGWDATPNRAHGASTVAFGVAELVMASARADLFFGVQLGGTVRRGIGALGAVAAAPSDGA